HAEGDVVIMMDGDGQHPPELIPELLRLHAAGYEVVQAQRVESSGRLSFKQVSARAFYWLASRIGELPLLEGGADFRLISRPVLMVLRQLGEYHRFYRGLIPWLGFRTAVVPFQPERRLAGRSKYSLRKMLKLASAGLFSFSLLPLKIGIVLGGLFVALALFELCYVAYFWVGGRQHLLVPGWSSIIILLTVGLGALMILIGFVGIYVGMIFQEVKRRPLYIVRSVFHCSGPTDLSPAT
ncbi:MAG: glycosyltransferase, partial [Bryobacteraceae bacterium]